ncbi:hypothetical protein F5876DRAFT_78983 [Lentinula aff. lateritia]|uniref:Uncharacterized protein n=1 Tax=Lentinula aff. lateritia TaxID=2804960 RepID=A0ACC1TU82_9AGAR|nr:hypothetical protein F5876DRAFT_78983 [Lentinula aff. lateritia]
MLFRPLYPILGLLAAVQAAPLDIDGFIRPVQALKHLNLTWTHAPPTMPFLIFVRFSPSPAGRSIDVPEGVIDRLVAHFRSILPVSREQIGFLAGSVWTHPGIQEPFHFEWYEVATPGGGWHQAHLD